MSFWVYIKLIYLNHRMRKNRFKSQLWSRNINIQMNIQFSSVHFSRSVVSDSLWPHESQHARPPCPSPTPGVHSNSCPSSGWCHPAISSSVVPSPPAPNPSKHQSELFAWGGQRTGLSALASVLPKNTQGWSPLGWAGGLQMNLGLPGGPSATTRPHRQCRRLKKHWFNPWVGKIPWRRAWQPSPVFFHGETNEQRNLAGYSPWGHA